jgi:6-methylpretetramide 4-monooxygenase
MTSQTDVAVAGGGPAGLTLALLMLRSGYRVTVLEKARSLERDYRGEILQPGGMTLLGELGVLKPARSHGAYPLRRFQLLEQDRTLMDIDYQQLPPPYSFLLSIPQRHILQELLEACGRYPGFTYVPGRPVSALIEKDAKITGVVHGTGSEAEQLLARCVVGADGRYSKVRRLAGIGYTRKETFAHDVMWFKIPAGENTRYCVQVHRGRGNPVLLYNSYPGNIQVGWTLPHRSYREVAAKGIGYVKDQILRAVPAHAQAIDDAVQSLTDLTLLDVFAGMADTWTRDGLVLIGDSAHTHGPIGAQGINLAIQDATELHPALVQALRTGDTDAGQFTGFTKARRPDIDAVMNLQARQSQALLSHGKASDTMRPIMMRLLGKTPLYSRILHRIAFGRRPINIRSELFSTAPTSFPG